MQTRVPASGGRVFNYQHHCLLELLVFLFEGEPAPTMGRAREQMAFRLRLCFCYHRCQDASLSSPEDHKRLISRRALANGTGAGELPISE